MQHKKVKLIYVFLFGIGIFAIQAQETTLTSGSNVSGSGGSVSYSVGQVVYTTNTGTSGSVAQGVQQPFEISVVTGIEENKDITLQCNAYPNPTSDFLILKMENYILESCNYQLYDVNGKLLENKRIEGNETSIDMLNLVPATYFLKVIQNEKEVKTFKIIKN